MFYVPAWLRRKSTSVFVTMILSFYTFSLMCVLYVSQYLAHTLLEHNDSMLNIRNYFQMKNVSRNVSYDVPRWEEAASRTLSMYLYKVQANISTKTPLQKKLDGRHSAHFRNSQLKSGYNQYSSNSGLHGTVSYFRSRLQDAYTGLLRKIIKVFDSVMTEHKIDYMIYGGTLIGSYRHHGLVPWDDDVDALVPLTAKDSLQQAFSNIGQEYILSKDYDSCWKLFSILSDPINGCSWRWPYLDIFFYAENKTHIWDVSPKYTYNFSYPKTIIFPLRRRPFMNLTLLAPHNPRAVIDVNYDIKLCKSGSWIHRWERQGREVTVLCSLLFSKFAFVRRISMNGGCNETLIQNEEITSYFFDDAVSCWRE